ncbi:hypothetical protein VNO78_24487 [Psophocarpus tetragonolobus]|uniref:Uncharacterized protein n=1 Tax=Psophocarpus tetragonolobus TaxID=3891 RepID=A0AAN9XF54_PSOTE
MEHMTIVVITTMFENNVGNNNDSFSGLENAYGDGKWISKFGREIPMKESEATRDSQGEEILRCSLDPQPRVSSDKREAQAQLHRATAIVHRARAHSTGDKQKETLAA